MMIKEFISALPKRFVWRLNLVTCIEFLLLAAIYPLVYYAPAELFVEDGWVENIQLVILAGAFGIALSAKRDKKFFCFAAMIVVLLVMRETNLGRAYFCAKYLEPGEICRWKNMKYGIYVEALRVIFGVFICYYFCRHKLWQSLWGYVVQAPLYVWELALIFIGAAIGTVAELRSVDNEVLEECGELLFYIAFANCLWRYSRLPQENK